jgi:molybdate transport system substrate-binding protein
MNPRPKLAAILRRAVIAAPAALVLAGACSADAAPRAQIVVFAAASLKNALDAANAKWHATGKPAAVVSYAASSTLAKQIDNGAPADIFISADRKWMDYVQQHGLIQLKTRVDLLGNRLVLIAPANSPFGRTIPVRLGVGFPLARLLHGGRLAMADPSAVPAGIYGKQALISLGVWSSVAGRIAAAQNVRAALALVARGEAPLGIVYRTDAAVEPGVRIVATFPPSSTKPIVYPAALTKTARPGAAAFEQFLRGPAAAAVFAAEGFAVLDRGP